MLKTLPLAWRLFRREMRQRTVQIVILSLTVAVAAVSGIGFLTERVDRAVNRQASELVAADLAVRSPHPMPAEWSEEATSRGLRSAETVEFRTVLFKGEDSQLVEVKAVDEAYPLRGTLKVADAPFVDGVETQSLPGHGEAWVEPRLLLSLKLKVGDQLNLGRTQVQIRKVITHEPDRGIDLIQMAPRVLVGQQTLADSALVQPHSRVKYRKLFA
ncbi:MAG: ABC transporter permease, partial [Gammaproteobacteria bacterium]